MKQLISKFQNIIIFFILKELIYLLGLESYALESKYASGY